MATGRSKALFGALLFFLTAGIPVSAPDQDRDRAESGHFLLISDIHFDPFYDGRLFDQLRSRPVERWAKILQESRPAGLNPRGADTNYALLATGLDDARRRHPDPDFILSTGDLMAHRWQAKYDALAVEPHLADPEAYRTFTAKAIRFLAGELRRRYPTTPILPALGNDAADCGDYRIAPGGPFLAMFAEAWGPLPGADAEGEDFRETFSRGGYYTVRLPGPRGHRLIVLNTVVFSIHYEDACGSGTQTPALDQLRWLARTLERAEAAGEVTWLLMHIPPGIDGFDTAESLGRGRPPETFWQPELTSRFLQLIGRHRSVVRFAFAGHTHMDDFRLIRPGVEPALPCKIAPALSPIFGNNPGYQSYRYDREAGTLLGYQTYFLPDLDGPGRPAAGEPGRWALEYDSGEAYGLDTLTALAFARLAGRIETDKAVRRLYARYYDVGAAPEIPTRTLSVYRCAITNLGPAGLQACLADTPSRRNGPAAIRPATRD